MTMAITKFAAGLIAVACLCTIGAPVAAGVTLEYTGQGFTSIGSPAAGTGITGYIVLDDFDASVGQEFTASNLLDWSISNGAYTLSKAHGDALTRFDMLTAAGGIFNSWAFDAQDTDDANWTKFSRTDSSELDISVVKDNSYSGESENVGSPGSWRVASGAVPEPASWTMLVLGFGAAGMAIRRGKAHEFGMAAG
jgi:hypothetical protein